MRGFILLFVMIASVHVQAQQFNPIYNNLALSDSVSTAVIELSDFDNDGLLDVAVIATASSTRFIQFVKGDTVSMPSLLSTVIFIDNFSSYSIIDYDDDNDLDFVFYGAQSAIYRNEGKFAFSKQLVDLPDLKKTLWADLDNDGRKEIVGNFLSGDETLLIVFKRTDSSSWQAVGDTLHLSVESLELMDADFDGYQDVFVSGKHGTDSLYTGILLNEGDFSLTPTQGQKWSGIISAGDLNGDGIFDIAFAGIDEQSNNINRLWLSTEGVDANVLQLTMTNSVFVADFNSDGKADINFFGKLLSDTVNLIQVASNDYDTLSFQHILSQRFGDVDREGDLDVVQLTKPDSLHVTFFENNISQNLGPSAPSAAIGLPVFNTLFLYWRTSADDHTTTKSLTYDVVLDPVQSAEFDLLNERRLRTSHGNNLTQNFKLFAKQPLTPSSFAIQGVDNSFTGGEICVGTTALNCPETENEVVRVCTNEQVVLNSPPNALWFSFSNGFLGTMSSLSFQVVETDTLFYFDPTVLGCKSLKAFTIEINNSPKVQFFEKNVCEQQIVRLGVEEDWETVAWTSLLSGSLGTQDSITYTSSVADSIFVHLTNSEGCDLLRKTAIHISKPSIKIAEEQLIILKGQEVQLHASGAERYQWFPGTNLSSAVVPDPVASPIATTTYTVTGYDSLNCSAQASVKIFVEDTGFVPNLFTPNNDGKNDELKIYGLKPTTAISFSIYNREGKLVYETKDAAQATQHGWDGTKNGMKQPSGVYIWKVTGTLSSGEPVLLNGKREGSIVLVR